MNFDHLLSGRAGGYGVEVFYFVIAIPNVVYFVLWNGDDIVSMP
jgi:hypothetical protein